MEVHFKGRIFPSHRVLALSGAQTVRWSFNNPVVYQVEMGAEIRDGEVDVKCEVSDLTPIIARHLRSRALDYCNLAVDLFTFATGLSFTVILDSCVLPDGTENSIHLTADDVGKLVSAIQRDAEGRLHGHADAFRRLFEQPQAVFALHDLTQCLSHPDLTAINVGRMLDGLRKLIIGSSVADDQAWAKFRDTLRVDRAYISLITEQSKEPRHGYRLDLAEPERAVLLNRGWTLMNRFIEYRKRGSSSPLPISEFPILKG